MQRKPKNIFVQGPITPERIATAIGNHSSKTDIGAHSIFLGQVRADEIEGSRVKAIEYTAYEPMALSRVHQIREAIFEKYPLSCLHIYHSLGVVRTGEICLFVFTSSKHRKAATAACNELVERIKKEVPVWGKEILETEEEVWKTNT